MAEGTVTVADPARTTRLVIAGVGALLLAASGFLGASLVGHPDGQHTGWTQDAAGRALLLLGVAAVALLVAAQTPNRVDARLGRAAMLAVAIVPIVAGLDQLVAVITTPPAADGAVLLVGPGTVTMLLAALVFLALHWMRGLWPESRWHQQLMAAKRG